MAGYMTNHNIIILIHACIIIGMMSPYDRVYHLAGEFAKHLQAQVKIDAPAGDRELWKFSNQEVLCAQIAGLCHDLGIINDLIIILNTYTQPCMHVML